MRKNAYGASVLCGYAGRNEVVRLVGILKCFQRRLITIKKPAGCFTLPDFFLL